MSAWPRRYQQELEAALCGSASEPEPEPRHQTLPLHAMGAVRSCRLALAIRP
jgi:hypothetical protein